MQKDNKDYRLVYVWIDNYKNIQHQGLHWTLDYHVEHQNHTVTAEPSLFGELDGNPLKPLDAFSAIVGMNGSGKSNFLYVIRQILCNGHFPNGASGFAIFEQTVSGGDKQLLMLTSEPDQYQFTSGNIVSDLGLERIQVVDYNPFGYNLIDTGIFPKSTAPWRIEAYSSLNSRHQEEMINSAKQFALSKKMLELFDALSSVTQNPHAHFVMRYSDLLEAVHASGRVRLSPKSRLQKEWMTEFRKYFYSKIEQPGCDMEMFMLCYGFLYWRELLTEYKYETEVLQASLNEASLAFMIITFFSGNKKHKLTPQINAANKYFGQPNSPDVSGYYRPTSGQSMRKVNALRSLNTFLCEHNELGPCLSIPFQDFNALSKLLFNITWLDIKSEELEKEKLIGNDFAFKMIHVTGLSSGEKQVMHFLGQLRDRLLAINGKRALILIDEIEATFHPEWQRNLVHFLSTLFDDIADNCSDFQPPQVVMVTHSPFVLSDILNGKTLALGEKKNQSWNTFGANIHELLSQSFFMKRNIGQSAAQVIMECAKEIDAPEAEATPNRVAQLRFVINHLADPLIKNQLTQRLNSIDKTEPTIQQHLRALAESNLTREDIIDRLDKMAGKN